jgi:hypothetical protein
MPRAILLLEPEPVSSPRLFQPALVADIVLALRLVNYRNIRRDALLVDEPFEVGGWAWLDIHDDPELHIDQVVDPRSRIGFATGIVRVLDGSDAVLAPVRGLQGALMSKADQITLA